MSRILLVLAVLLATAGAVVAYGDPVQIARAKSTVSSTVSGLLRPRAATRAVQIARAQGGEFALQAKINGVNAPMVIDTGATSVVLTHDAAVAAGLPVEMIHYTVNVDTANGRAQAAPVTLDRIAVGSIVERAVPALIAPPGQLKTSLLGMSFLSRLQGWEVRGDKVTMRGTP